MCCALPLASGAPEGSAFPRRSSLAPQSRRRRAPLARSRGVPPASRWSGAPWPAKILQPAEGVLGAARRRPVLQPDVTLVAVPVEMIQDEPVVDLTGPRLPPARHVRDLDVTDQVQYLSSVAVRSPSIPCMWYASY